jgi:hypothetical protein
MTLLSNFLSPSTSPLTESTTEHAKFVGIQGFHHKTFKLLDEQTISIDIILYAGRREGEIINPDNNGIAIAISQSNLIADKLLPIKNSSEGASEEQTAFFEKLIQIEDYLTFANTVNTLAAKSGRLRTVL